ncbi:MAG: hypothetical protein ABIB65_01545 [Candidatus Margulisiibacteriota bacterium]
MAISLHPNVVGFLANKGMQPATINEKAQLLGRHRTGFIFSRPVSGNVLLQGEDKIHEYMYGLDNKFCRFEKALLSLGVNDAQKTEELALDLMDRRSFSETLITNLESIAEFVKLAMPAPTKLEEISTATFSYYSGNCGKRGARELAAKVLDILGEASADEAAKRYPAGHKRHIMLCMKAVSSRAVIMLLSPAEVSERVKALLDLKVTAKGITFRPCQRLKTAYELVARETECKKAAKTAAMVFEELEISEEIFTDSPTLMYRTHKRNKEGKIALNSEALLCEHLRSANRVMAEEFRAGELAFERTWQVLAKAGNFTGSAKYSSVLEHQKKALRLACKGIDSAEKSDYRSALKLFNLAQEHCVCFAGTPKKKVRSTQKGFSWAIGRLYARYYPLYLEQEISTAREKRGGLARGGTVAEKVDLLREKRDLLIRENIARMKLNTYESVRDLLNESELLLLFSKLFEEKTETHFVLKSNKMTGTMEKLKRVALRDMPEAEREKIERIFGAGRLGTLAAIPALKYKMRFRPFEANYKYLTNIAVFAVKLTDMATLSECSSLLLKEALESGRISVSDITAYKPEEQLAIARALATGQISSRITEMAKDKKNLSAWAMHSPLARKFNKLKEDFIAREKMAREEREKLPLEQRMRKLRIKEAAKRAASLQTDAKAEKKPQFQGGIIPKMFIPSIPIKAAVPVFTDPVARSIYRYDLAPLFSNGSSDGRVVLLRKFFVLLEASSMDGEVALAKEIRKSVMAGVGGEVESMAISQALLIFQNLVNLKSYLLAEKYREAEIELFAIRGKLREAGSPHLETLQALLEDFHFSSQKEKWVDFLAFCRSFTAPR